MKHSVYISAVRKFQKQLNQTPAWCMKKKRERLAAEFTRFVSKYQFAAQQDFLRSGIENTIC